MLVTTSYEPSPEQLDRVRRLAAEAGGTFVPRKRLTLPGMRAKFGTPGGEAPAILVATERELKYYTPEGTALFFHPSTAAIRAKRLLRGEGDIMLAVAGVMPGDRVIDCTAGLGSDAIVFALATGPLGAVTALESEPAVALLLQEGLAVYASGIAALDEAMRRIDVRRVDHLAYLREQPDNSADIVYFDPMFRRPIGASSSISPLRGMANDGALSPEAVAEAARVARKRVVLKEHRDSGEFARLGFEKNARGGATKVAYGVMTP